MTTAAHLAMSLEVSHRLPIRDAVEGILFCPNCRWFREHYMIQGKVWIMFMCCRCSVATHMYSSTTGKRVPVVWDINHGTDWWEGPCQVKETE